MQQIADWLKDLGLSEYAQRFADNDIDFAILGELTDQDLEKIGVASLGHRRKLLRAIANFEAIEKRASANYVAAAAPTAPRALDTAERRQVTVMFSDLVGSTALSARMDPEDLREVISAYQQCVADTVRRLGGFVAKYLGDGVLVYFGYPEAREDDAERAVRAGLELVAAVGALKTRAALQTRVGIATGLVVIGDLIGSGEAQERGIVGETPNLAARLQGVAAPDRVVIAEDTRRLLGNLFELEDLGPKELKGIPGPVRAWAALRPSSVESRFEALHTSGLAALIGREEELELLLQRWSRAKTGEGQVMLLSGEAGIGKSRLAAALLENLVGEPHTRLHHYCSPQHTDSALFPIISQLERAAGLARNDTPQAKLDKLDALLAQTSTSVQDAALFAEMLSLPNDGRYPVLELDPQQRRQRTLEALVSQMEALTRQNPVLMIFEDAHWTDPTSLEVFGRIVDRIRTLRALLIVTFRPEFEPPWIGQPNVTALTINRLTQREVSAMIDQVIGNKLLPARIRRDIIERADGIPLFVEEMTKTVLEGDGEGDGRRTAAAALSPALAVPASLQASLMARLDRLGPAKEVAQIGAAIGREFPHALLAAVVRKPEAELGSALDHLIAAGLLFRRGVPPHATYLFNHALVQDEAYGMLLREPKRALHARIAETLESQFGEIAESQPELLARHYAEAGQQDKAFHYLSLSGQKCLDMYSLEEAEGYFRRALSFLATAPQCAGNQAVATVVGSLLEVAYLRGDYLGLGHVIETYLPRLQAIGDTPQLVFALYFQSMLLAQHCDFRAAEARANLALDIARRLGVVRAQAYAQSALFFCSTILGRYSLDVAEVEGAGMLETCTRAGDNYILNWAYWSIAWDYVCRGLTKRARTWTLKLIEAGQKRQDNRALGMAYWTLAWIDIQDLRYGDAIANAQKCLKAAATPFDRTAGTMASATGLVLQGRFDEGLAQLLALKKWALANGWLYQASGVDFAAGPALAATGRIAEGIRMLESGIAACDASGSRAMASWNRLSLAEIYLQMLLTRERPSIKFLLANLGAIGGARMFGVRRARLLLSEASQNEQLHESGTTLCRIEMDFAKLYRRQKRADLARAHLQRARLAATAQDSPLLAEIDALSQSLT